MSSRLHHESWMKKALGLAEKGRRAVSPNPMVGACLVKNNRLMAEGWHQVYGGDHAEIVAIKKAGKKARGATLYVTLEPCGTWGKTPPCAAAILEAGIREVVIGALDPNPQNHGKGVAALKKSGIKVTSGILAKEFFTQNESFVKYITQKLPFVTLKMAQSLDGKIATRAAHSRWISSKASRKFVHQLRADQDAILVGTKTWKQDDPLLSPRIKPVKGRETRPWRVLLDPRGELSSKARSFQGEQITVSVISENVILRPEAEESRMLRSAQHDTRILLPVRNHPRGLDLHQLMQKLASLGIAKVLVEGGGELAWSLVSQNLVDKIFWIIAPKFIGGSDAKTSLEGKGVKLASQALPVKIIRQTNLGSDILIEGRLK